MQSRRVRPRSASPRPVTVPGFHVLRGTHAPGSILPLHSHDKPSICFVQHGGFTEHYRGRTVECRGGMVKVTPAGEQHWNRFGDELTAGLRVDVDMARFDALPEVLRALDNTAFTHDTAVHAAAARVLPQLELNDDAAAIAVEGMLLELVSLLVRARDGAAVRGAPWLRRARDIVHDQFSSRISLDAVAQLVGVHPSTLARAYRREFGCSVGEEIRRLRLEHAAAELVATERALTMIALDCGFYDQSHFVHAFRRRYGCAPGEYRQALAPPRVVH
jgi:AraC family transcriptional regulator